MPPGRHAAAARDVRERLPTMRARRHMSGCAPTRLHSPRGIAALVELEVARRLAPAERDAHAAALGDPPGTLNAQMRPCPTMRAHVAGQPSGAPSTTASAAAGLKPPGAELARVRRANGSVSATRNSPRAPAGASQQRTRDRSHAPWFDIVPASRVEVRGRSDSTACSGDRRGRARGAGARRGRRRPGTTSGKRG